ncbi:unnamed protein product [Dovyalis caffra]|uniref:Uncharacterized protein n=1 Tax=Dovyalis caffra TaxID=77055 RepID=A0AAV1SII6_9ROSI|nr:unnamed protein product [Dovyalis caffra]
MIDEEDDDFHENRVIEVRWREAIDGLDNLRVLGRLYGHVAYTGTKRAGDGEWIDDGRPRASAQAAAIAQAIEEQFCRSCANSGVRENQPCDDPLSNDGQLVVDGDNTGGRQADFDEKMAMKLPTIGPIQPLILGLHSMVRVKAASVAETIEHNRSIGGTHEVPDEEEIDIRQRQGTPRVEGSCACTSKSVDGAKHEDRIGRYNGNQPINGDRNGFHA